MEPKIVQLTFDRSILTKAHELRGLINGAFYASIGLNRPGVSDMLEHILESYDTLIAKPINEQIMNDNLWPKQKNGYICLCEACRHITVD